MVSTKVTVKINGKVTAALIDRVAQRGANSARERVRANMKSGGRMASTLYVQRLSSTPTRAVYEVGSDLFYTVYQEFGTGIYAGKGPITPKRANWLRFKPKGSSVYVFAKQVRGVRPGRFFQRAVTQITVSDFTR